MIRRIVFVMVFIFIAVFLIFIAIRYDVQLATFFVLLLTLSTIFWYTHETYLLRLQHIRPCVLVLRQSTTPTDNRHKLENVGNGTAFNIRVTEASTTKHPLQIDHAFLPILRPNEESSGRPVIKGQGSDPSFDAVFDDPQHKTYEVTVLFEDVEGNTYETLIAFKTEHGAVSSSIKRSCRRSLLS